ncbi:hypothetical protein ACIBG8_41140 [Nonomuraea sp. NPDC050556]|uniref:hypothetical protein n=1 Tax=Nonomuraea sp. NPDC050556 TaxID=3364369 RepID=UPI0037B6684A
MTFTKRLSALTILAAVSLGGGTAAMAAAAPQEQGVRLPIDYTDAQEAKLAADYKKCLVEKGVKFVDPTGPAVLGTKEPAPGQEAKIKLCADKKVLMPAEMEETAPGYKANFKQWVKLLNEAGVGVEQVSWGWTYTEAYAKHPLPEAKQRVIERETRIKAFSN